MSRPDPNLDTEGQTFARRAAAVIIDLALLAVVTGTIWLPLAVFGEAGPTVTGALVAITTFTYFTALEAYSGQTLGKKILGIVVVTNDGTAPDVAAVAIRNLLRFFDWLPAFYLIGAVLIAITEREQRLGDLAARTLVVRVADSEADETASRDRDDDEKRKDDPIEDAQDGERATAGSRP